MSKKNAKGANQTDIWKMVKAYSGFYLMFLPVFTTGAGPRQGTTDDRRATKLFI